MDRKRAKETLLELHELFNSIGLPHFLVQGTALGAYRDKDFTPTELDIDIGFLYENFQPWADGDWLVKTFQDMGFEVEQISRPFTRIRTMVIDRDDVHLDLVSFVKWKDKRFVSRPLDERDLEPYSIVHPAHLIEPPYHHLTFFDKRFAVPNPIETYLRWEYGRNWHTPKKDHVSRTRIYDYHEKEGIPDDYLDAI